MRLPKAVVGNQDSNLASFSSKEDNKLILVSVTRQAVRGNSLSPTNMGVQQNDNHKR